MMRFTDAAHFEAWLAGHHDTAGEIWLAIARRGATAGTVTIEQALEVALCYGWIDSHRKAGDQDTYLQRYSPRRAGSRWSRVNVERAESLIAAGRMRPPGLAQIAAARADGRWAAAYAAQRDAPLPPDLAAALAADPVAATRFQALGKTARYRLVLPLLTARTARGRAARLDRAVGELSR
ncbi:hypothetical protein Sru01_30020 [Sphaerisporangium rufum]|uniref:OmdA domain containing protein n=1 Tax=Sphaerisporangium rufum TaxID=1381558 RepID=A0A919R6C3_9ACTN|nr:YdeI/OmpD-associated family protein [Sphaerisporangium rufum]GII78020.1 hypothetical protein Sru01_30020 [Sphaerisporangium rufum]